MTIIFYSNYSNEGEIVGGVGKLYIGDISIPNNINHSPENFTADEAEHFLNHNIANMDNIALVAGGINLTIGDVTINTNQSPTGAVTTLFHKFNQGGIVATTNIAEFNLELYHKYLMPFTNYNENENYSCLTYGDIQSKGCKMFDLMFVQENEQKNIKIVWIMTNCYAEPKSEFNTDAKTVMILNHTFIINRQGRINKRNLNNPIYILKIKGESENAET